MAVCTPTGSLEVFIRESIKLPNGNEEVATNSKKIANVNQLVRRIDTISANYDSTVTISDGSCIYVYGCIDELADNYNPWANVDNGTCAQIVSCTPGLSLIDVAIKLDNWPSETSWMLYSATDTFASVVPGTYDYTQAGQTVHTQTCVPAGDTIWFSIYDTYGDGIGGGSIVGSCVVNNVSCGENIFKLNPPNFNYD